MVSQLIPLVYHTEHSFSQFCEFITVKPALTVTSVKRSPAHNGQFPALPTFFTI